MYCENVSANPDSGRAITHSRGAAPRTGGSCDDVAHRAARQHGVRLGEARPVGGQLGSVAGRPPAGRSSSSSSSSSRQQPAAGLAAEVDALAAQPGLPDDARQACGRRRPRPGSCAAAATRRRRTSSSGANTHQVGIARRPRSGPWRSARPDRPERSHIQRTTSVSVTPRGRAAVQTAARPSCSDAMPPQACPKSPVSSRLRSAVHGEWSDTTMSMSPSARPAHSRSWLAASRIGGQHLNSVAPSGTSSAATA